MANQVYRPNVINLIRLVSRQTQSFRFVAHKIKIIFYFFIYHEFSGLLLFKINSERTDHLDIL